MSFEFHNTTIGEQITLQRGFDITKKEQEEGLIPVVSSGGVSSYHNVAKVSGPGVILGRKGTLGTVFFIEEDYWPHDTTLWVKDFKGNNPSFVYYFFKNISKQLKSMDVGAANPALNRNHVHPLEVTWPSNDVQERISKILSSLDRKIKNNDKINQTLEQMSQALFKSWFVDFEPVKAKIAVLEAGGSQKDATLAAMTAISGKDTDALVVFEYEHPEQYAELKATAELFPSAMQDSELGEIPEGWNVIPIGETGKVICGKTPSKKESEFYGGDIPFIKIPDMHEQLFVIKTNEYLSETGSDSQIKKLLPAQSICVSCIATVGVVAITTQPSHTNQQINSIIPSNKSSLYYLYFCMAGQKDYLHALGSAGSATLNVNTSTFSAIKILMPNVQALNKFHDKSEAFFNVIKSRSLQSESLAQLRDTLLPKLLSGEITLPEVEQAVSEVENV